MERVDSNDEPTIESDPEFVFRTSMLRGQVDRIRSGVPHLAIAVFVVLAAAVGWSWFAGPGGGSLDETAIPTITTAVLPSTPEVNTTSGAGIAVVHVSGAVAEPGVYEVDLDSRVHEAISLAGGPTDDADVHQLPLAELVPDGASIYVPLKGEEPTEPLIGKPASGSDAEGSVESAPVNINIASAEELLVLTGVGPATAEAIVTWRTENGPFLTIEDLVSVPGIGPTKLEQVRDDIVI